MLHGLAIGTRDKDPALVGARHHTFRNHQPLGGACQVPETPMADLSLRAPPLLSINRQPGAVVSSLGGTDGCILHSTRP